MLSGGSGAARRACFAINKVLYNTKCMVVEEPASWRSPAVTDRTFKGSMKFILRTLAASIALFLLNAALRPSWEEAVSALMVCTMLCWITERSRVSGAELVATLAGFYFILASALNIPEGVFFDVIKVGQAPLMMAQQLGIALAIAIVIAVLFGRTKMEAAAAPVWRSDMSILGLIWRLAASIGVFLVCYFGAGMLIFPLVKSYYQGRTMPTLEAMAAMVSLRAVLLIFAAGLVSRKIPSRKDARLILATAFPVIGVISLMIPHNELMPPFVRLVHTVETAPYYALCGFLFATWFGPPRAGGSKTFIARSS
jgi:hypothetical protein